MPHGFPVAATVGASRAGHSASPFALPSSPSPPARETAAASAPPADPPIGASAIGYRTPDISVNAVDHSTPAPSRTRPPSRSPVALREVGWGQLWVLVWISLTARGVGSEVMVWSSRPPPQVAPVQVQAIFQVIVAVICQAPPGWPVEERL